MTRNHKLQSFPLSMKSKQSWHIALLKPALIIFLMLVCAGAHALRTDREQALSFSADFFERDEQKGTITCSGNVIIRQGSMKITAEKVVIFDDEADNSKVAKIIATGIPARYEQKPSEEQGLVVAQAKRLEYNVSGGTLHLIENALLQQEGTKLSGMRIDYDVKSSVVKAGGDKDQQERVHMVIPAKALQQEENN